MIEDVGIRCVANVGVGAGRVYVKGKSGICSFYEVIKNCPRCCKVDLSGRKVSSASLPGAQ